MEHCGSGTPQPANKFKMADRRMKLHETKLHLDVAQHCFALLFPCRNFCAVNFVMFFYEIKLSLTYFNHGAHTLVHCLLPSKYVYSIT